MLYVNEKMDCNEEVVKSDEFEEAVQAQSKFYNPNFSVNYFGLGRAVEDWEN